MSAGRTTLLSADRVDLPIWLSGGLTGCTAVALGIAGQSAAQGRLSPGAGFAAGAFIGVLAVVGLPSLSIRVVARSLLLLSAAVLVRFGVLGGSISTNGQFLLGWLVVAAAVLVLCDQVATASAAAMGGVRSPSRPVRVGSTARTAAVVAGAIVLVAVLLAPLLLPHIGSPTSAGKGPTLGSIRDGASSLRASESLDMTERPKLTDEVVFTVDTDHATFWRGETFDQWDGQRWTRSDGSIQRLRTGDRLDLAADDLGARGGNVVRQRIRIEASYADVLYAAPSAVQVQIDRPVRQRRDGTLISAPLGQGGTYTVTSRRIPLTEERLRALDTASIPAEITARYAQPPVTTDRVRRVAARITAGSTNQYDRVLAIEAWMGKRVKYSLDAPLAPKGQDVVDHFLFDAEEGWCEQIASSLVVLARQNGIPARLVTGYVPDDRDPVTGVYSVRARDAHAWAEVWFPEVGWVPFDPTAHVALAGSDAAKPTVSQWLAHHAVVIGLGLLVLVLAAGPLRAWIRRRWSRRAEGPPSWSAVVDRRLDELGRRVERSRRPDETATAFAAVLADRYGEPALAGVGRLIDDQAYAAREPSAAERNEVQAILDRVAAAPAPPVVDDEPVPVPTG